jgi:hypothetical protein
MGCFRWIILLSGAAMLFTLTIASDCPADCLACWELRGVIVNLKDGTRIEGYATWNHAWAREGNCECSCSNSNGDESASRERSPVNANEFPGVIFHPAAAIKCITVYTHLRSIKYPWAAVVTTNEPIKLGIGEIEDIKLTPGPHDGYGGAGDIPLVSPRFADLLQTKPAASCESGDGFAYWVSYDRSFPEEELRRLCEQFESDEEVVKKLKARDIFSLYFAGD